MKFSVIIPVHNAAGRIHNALNSIVTQTFKDVQIIAVCDSCEDNSAAIARSYGAIVDEIEAGNDGAARNRGLELASGEFVMFIDDDDDWWLHPRVLEIVNRDVTESSEFDVYCYGFIWGSLGYRAPDSNAPGNSLFPNVWSKVWRRSAVGDTRFPNIYYCSDMYFSNAVFKKTQSIKLSNDPIYYYNYLREGSISHRVQLKGH